MYKKLDHLCEDEKIIREEVFVKEQGFAEEFDTIDDTSTHLVFYDEETPVAVCRYYPGEEGEYHVGRVAIRKAYRGNQRGKHVMEAAENCIKADGGRKISVSAQLRVKGFYESCGYTALGEIYLDQGCEHIHMEKFLDK